MSNPTGINQYTKGRKAYAAGLKSGRSSVRGFSGGKQPKLSGKAAAGYFAVGRTVGLQHAKLLRAKQPKQASIIRKSTHKK